MQIRENRLLIAAILVAMLLIGIYLRLGLLKYQGFSEPDSFFYYALVKATISNHFVMPQILSLSGFPIHRPHGEAPGLAYLPILIYLPMSLLGADVLTVMRLLPVLAGMLDAIGIFFIVRYLRRSDWLALLAAFFISVSIGNIARTGALVYRGDTYISVVIIYSMLFAMMALNEKEKRKTYAFSILSAVTLSLGIVMWNGASFTIAVYLIALVLIFCTAFLSEDIGLLEKNNALITVLLLAYLLDRVYMSISFAASGYPFYGNEFFLFFAPALFANLAAAHLLKRTSKHALLSSFKSRLIALAALGVVGIIALLLLSGSVLARFSVGNLWFPAVSPANTTDLMVANAMVSTIQELQKPSFSFLFGSFGVQLILAPLGVLLFIFLNYKSKPVGSINITPEFLLLFSYLAVASYLQSNVTRFSSILSMPLAVFAAYGLYSIAVLVRRRWPNRQLYWHSFIVVVAAVLLYSLYFANSFALASVQYDGINIDFLNAMAWLRANTQANATVIAAWPDGSVVEGWADRTSLMDSVAGQHRYLVYNFSYNFPRFMFNTTANTRYLYAANRPQYIVVRRFWLSEINTFAREGLLNPGNYSYYVLGNATLSDSSQGQYLNFTLPSYSVRVLLKQDSSGISAASAYFSAVNGNKTPISKAVFYNQLNKNYTTLSSNSPAAFNYTLLVQYSGVTIESAYLVSKPLSDSNMFKLLFLCNSQACPLNSIGNARFTQVFANNDTSIFRLGYSG